MNRFLFHFWKFQAEIDALTKQLEAMALAEPVRKKKKKMFYLIY